MSYTILNLALPVVNNKIDQLLLDYPVYPYQRAFAAPELRQKLVAYVLSRLPACYITLEASQVCSLESPLKCYSQEQLQHIEGLVEQGIVVLVDWAAARFKQEQEAVMAPSSWFG